MLHDLFEHVVEHPHLLVLTHAFLEITLYFLDLQYKLLPLGSEIIEFARESVLDFGGGSVCLYDFGEGFPLILEAFLCIQFSDLNVFRALELVFQVSLVCSAFLFEAPDLMIAFLQVVLQSLQLLLQLRLVVLRQLLLHLTDMFLQFLQFGLPLRQLVFHLIAFVDNSR